MRFDLKALPLILLLTTAFGCGKQVNSMGKSPFTESAYSYLTIERQCASGKTAPEPVTEEITEMYNLFQVKFPVPFFNIPVKLYDYKNPLVVNLDEMEQKLAEFKSHAADTSYVEEHAGDMAIEIYYLYQKSMRFEGQKCQLSNLVSKKNNDLRPYFELRDFCQEKDNNPVCNETTLNSLNKSDASFVEERTVKMCKSFDPSDVNCQAQYNVQSKNQKISTLVSYYQNLFKKERYEKLFSLRESHLKFSCEADESEVVTMTIPVNGIKWDTEKLNSLLSYVSGTWTRGHFKLNFEIVEDGRNDAVEIISASGGISYVPDNNNRLIYLSQSLDANTQRRVLAHEFGHVLGFPDCYTEFYDNQKNDLVYYEISSEDTNIMCSMKNGVSVPDSYFQELRENSCVFN